LREKEEKEAFFVCSNWIEDGKENIRETCSEDMKTERRESTPLAIHVGNAGKKGGEEREMKEIFVHRRTTVTERKKKPVGFSFTKKKNREEKEPSIFLSSPRKKGQMGEKTFSCG